jgi:hypothetical protein
MRANLQALKNLNFFHSKGGNYETFHLDHVYVSRNVGGV